MARAQTLAPAETAVGIRHEQAALGLAAVMPRLVVAARRTAATVMHGLHGRRRAGTGENFWQFRRFSSGEPAGQIDWRRSARDDHLYVREREWEAAHTVWLWIDRSRSMAYRSDLAPDAKVERAVVLALASAELLVRGGERAGLLGLGRPTASRRAIELFAETLALAPDDATGIPPAVPIAPLSEAVLIGDFLAPVAETAVALKSLAARGARGHLVVVSDPIEDIFPFTGRTELRDPEAGTRFTAGRAQDLKADYVARLGLHREALRAAATPLGWDVAFHRTDRSAAEALLALHARFGERPAAATVERAR
jgi:uncharacterized protein (DUF58 family)